MHYFIWLEKVIVLPLILTKIQCFSSFYCSLWNCFFKCDTNIIAFQLHALELVYVGWSPALPSTIYCLCNFRQVVQCSSVCFFNCRMGRKVIFNRSCENGLRLYINCLHLIKKINAIYEVWFRCVQELKWKYHFCYRNFTSIQEMKIFFVG